MPSLTIVLDHALPRAEAQRCVKALLDQLYQRYAARRDRVSKHWRGNVLTFEIHHGLQSVFGRASISATKVTIEVNLSWTLGFWKGRIQKVIKQEGRRLLAG